MKAAADRHMFSLRNFRTYRSAWIIHQKHKRRRGVLHIYIYIYRVIYVYIYIYIYIYICISIYNIGSR